MMAAAVRELAAGTRPGPIDPRPADVKGAIERADGTELAALPKLVETLCRRNRDRSAYHAFRGHGILHGRP